MVFVIVIVPEVKYLNFIAIASYINNLLQNGVFFIFSLQISLKHTKHNT